MRRSGRCPMCEREIDVGQPCDHDTCRRYEMHAIPDADFYAMAPHGTRTKDHLVGRVLDGQLLVEFVGSGGFGTVYRSLGAPVFVQANAFKLLRSTPLAEVPAHYAERLFEREVEALRRLNHRNIVRLFGAGRCEDGRRYLLMEFVEGGRLLSAVTRQFSGGFPWRVAQHVLYQALDGLGAAHSLDIIHRDIKPDNLILVRRDADPWVLEILDFGLAKAIDETAELSVALGTPRYMAPEQLRLDDDALGPPADLYAVGVIAFELLTGHAPFPSNTREALRRKLDPDYDPTSVVRNGALAPLERRVFLKALARHPDDRYQTAAEVRAALDELFAHYERNGRPGAWDEETVDPGLTGRIGIASLLSQAAAAGDGSGIGEAAGTPACDDAPDGGPVDPAAPTADATYRRQTCVFEDDVPFASTPPPLPPPAPASRVEPRRQLTEVLGDVVAPPSFHEAPTTYLPFVPPRASVPSRPARWKANALPAWFRTVWTFHRNAVLGALLTIALSVATVGLVIAVATAGTDAPRQPTDNGETVIPVRETVPKKTVPKKTVPKETTPNGSTPTEATPSVPDDMALIPAAAYVVGCTPDGRDGCLDHDGPPHASFLASFAIDRLPVNAGAYAECVARGACPRPSDGAPACNVDTDGRARRPSHPVNCVSHAEAAAYCASLGRRLPTEAEWEAAAGGDRHQPYPWGTEPPDCARSAMRCSSEKGGTVPAGRRALDRSSFGVFDLGGNVREWTDTRYGAYARGVTLRGLEGLVVRGSSYRHGPTEFQRVWNRDAEPPARRLPDLGFRCALGLEGTAP